MHTTLVVNINSREQYLPDRVESAVHAVELVADGDSVTTRSYVDDAAGGEYRPRYNGHPNRETWTVALWLGNDERLYNAAREIVRDAFAEYAEPAMLADIRDRAELDPSDPYSAEEHAADRLRGALHDAGDELRQYVDELLDREAGPSGLAADLLSYALACVDWSDVAEGFAEDLPAPGAETEEPDVDDDTGPEVDDERGMSEYRYGPAFDPAES